MRYICFALVMLYVFSLKAQVLYVKDFGTSYSGWSYSANYTSGVADNGGTTIRSCTFGNGDDLQEWEPMLVIQNQISMTPLLKITIGFGTV